MWRDRGPGWDRGPVRGPDPHLDEHIYDYDAGQPYPANARWVCLKAGMVKPIPEARLKELASRGQLKLELK